MPRVLVLLLGLLPVSATADGAFLALHDERGLPPTGPPTGRVARGLALRQAIETARGDRAIDDLAGALRKSPVQVGNNVHVVGTSPSDPAAVIEWDGNSLDHGVTVRRPGTEVDAARLICTNHYRLRAERDGSCGRYEKLEAELQEAATAGRRIGFEAACRLLDRVSASGSTVTHFSVICWPADRRYAFAVSPSQGESATRGRWVTVEWAELFGP